MSPEQCRAARALLDVSQRELADWCGLSLRSVQGFESGQRALQSLALSAIERILTTRGIVVIDEKDWTGVKLSRSR